MAKAAIAPSRVLLCLAYTSKLAVDILSNAFTGVKIIRHHKYIGATTYSLATRNMK